MYAPTHTAFNGSDCNIMCLAFGYGQSACNLYPLSSHSLIDLSLSLEVVVALPSFTSALFSFISDNWAIRIANGDEMCD